MEGEPDSVELRGIIPNAFQQIFDRVGLADSNHQFLVRASYLEIYNEEIRDLLCNQKNKLELKENADNGVYVRDLTSFLVKSSHEIDQVMQAGKKNRSVGATLMNQGSSRSHAIFSIIVEHEQHRESSSRDDDTNGSSHITVGKLNLVDLAGSERQSKTGATGDRLKEATKINLSLSALGNVISALVDGKSQHIPYRDSKLTRLLQDSLGGNTKTVMCANCGPAGYNYDETLSTLRYANRAKNIKNKPRINEDPKDAMLREFTDEIARLKKQLAQSMTGSFDEDGLPTQAESKIDDLSDDEVVEKEIIKEKVKEVMVGVSHDELERIRQDAAQMKQTVQEETDRELAALLQDQARTEEERERLRADLVRAETERKREKEIKRALLKKLKGMQSKLIVGGEMLTKAEKQQAELRAAQQALQEQEAEKRCLDQELAQQDEAKIDLFEKYSSIDEEVEKKTRKLQKLLKKVNAAEKELQDLQNEFQNEREDMLDTIRQLARQVKLKETIAEHFVPRERVEALEKRTVWNETNDSWTLRPFSASSSLLKKRSSTTNSPHGRPETEYARQRRQYDPNPRYKFENVCIIDLEVPPKLTQEYRGPDDRSNVHLILTTLIDHDDPQIEMDHLDNETKETDDPQEETSPGDTVDEKPTPSSSKGRSAALLAEPRGWTRSDSVEDKDERRTIRPASRSATARPGTASRRRGSRS